MQSAAGDLASTPIATPAKASASGESVGPGEYSSGMLIAAKYRLDALLGEGGMGSVWLARNMTLHVDVAVKLIRREVASDETAERLLDEARAAAQVDHPSIVRVHDFGETERHDPFIVMELLKGASLRAVMGRRGRLEPTAAVQLLLPIVSALSVVHAKGIIHRDIKPDNILLVENEAAETIPKLFDFGIARLPHRTLDVEREEGPLGEETASEIASRLTQMGRLLGSPQYMSPEQARADLAIDNRTDLWALSVVLYEAICGALPFDHPDAASVLVLIMTQPPRPIADRGVDAPGLWAILAKGLAKERSARWQSARELGEALALWLLERGIDTDASGRSIRRVWLPNAASLHMSSVPPAASPPRPLLAARALHMSAAVAGLVVLGGAIFWSASGGRDRDESAVRSAAGSASPAVAGQPLLESDGPCPKGMKSVAGGTFQMGSNDSAFPYWKPAHEVTIDGFCLDEKEVTVAQYRACVAGGSCRTANTRPDFPKRPGASDQDHEKQLVSFAELCNWDKTGRDDHPINCVDWYRADAHCRYRSARLPTEAEWELAARGTDGRRFPWGNDRGDETYMNAAGLEWRRWLESHQLPAPARLMYEADDRWPGTAPVGRFPRAMTQAGQLDMVGNVWEWASDWYTEYEPNAQINPQGPADGDRKVIRGGGFNGEIATWLNPAARYFQLATASVHAIGFRCASRPTKAP